MVQRYLTLSGLELAVSLSCATRALVTHQKTVLGVPEAATLRLVPGSGLALSAHFTALSRRAEST